MNAHAKLRPPSGAEGWMGCAGWQPNGGSSIYSVEGSCAHWVASECLIHGKDALDYAGHIHAEDNIKVEVDDEMCAHVQNYINFVRDLAHNTQGILMVEQRLPIEQITHEADAHGTSDAVILAGTELIVVDLKYGKGLAVDARDNKQLQIYALAALDQFGLAEDFQTVRIVIHQPRIGSNQ